MWEFIKRHTPDPEHEDLRRLIGVKLITDIEDLQKETVFLKEIHDEYREETNELSSQKNAIFENEFQRNALVSKIRFLVEQIKEKTHTFNKDDSLRRGSRESFVVDYALSQENATPRRSGSFISGMLEPSYVAKLWSRKADCHHIINSFLRPEYP